MKIPLSYYDFVDETMVWVRFKYGLEDQGLITEFNLDGIVVFDTNYKYEDLVNKAEWSINRITWNEFFEED